MLNPAMASGYPIRVGSFLYARVDKVDQSVLFCSAVSIDYFVSSYSPPEEHGNMVLILSQHLISKRNNRCTHLHVRPTVTHVNSYT